ncbi:glycosyltransferase [Nocardioides sp. TF02-7]|uniref:glycosyltransferase family 2 protein n=1 Tax=Nocardioides sp. TF02-7 TaxID=2917724 RepID=UPI001F0562C3|nr:glycosyltransferase [Nocardioides sp. TF02-7]UMG93185.1 glycosyltransferase [Nocardioides sp. TF02-7]
MSGVSVVLVSHDGSSWLSAVLRGISEQTVAGDALDAVVAVDTGSKDGSADLVESTLAALPTTAVTVLRESGRTTYPQAVALALDTLRRQGSTSEWVWLLHDDSNPAPDALACLLAAAADRPDVDFLGPKLREWPSLKRLLEVGVTISGTGRRETGLERGEYDQGQHDEVREVLAVNSAGLLARRAVLEELGGYDEQLAMFGNDLDLGWRAAAAGRTTLVVPQAVVFHAEAAHRGVRRTPLTGRHTHYQERRAALYTLLANCRTAALPWQVVRLAVGSLLRVLGFLLVRSAGEALDELAALLAVYARPGQVRAARRSRRRDGVDRKRVRRLLAPWWLPYRHGLDFLEDLVAAATNQAADVAERRRAAAAERDPSPPQARHRTDEDDDLADNGLAVRFLTDPVAVVLAVVAIVFVVGAREAFGAVSGGALSPVPADAGEWWRLHVESWHPVGFGSAVPAPAYVLPLALLGSLLTPETAMSALLVGAAPLALWGAWRFLRVVGRLVSRYGAPRWLLLWGATTYALVPLVSGAWSDGRWGRRRGGRPAAVAGPRRARLRRPRGVAPVARRLAVRAPPRADHRRRAGDVAPVPRPRRGRPRRRRAGAARRGARPVGVGAARHRARRTRRAARAVVGSGARRGRGSSAAARRRTLADRRHRRRRPRRGAARRRRRAVVARPAGPDARPARPGAALDAHRRRALLAGGRRRRARRAPARRRDARPRRRGGAAARPRTGAAGAARGVGHRRAARGARAHRPVAGAGHASAAGPAGARRPRRRRRSRPAGGARVVRGLGR